MTQTIEGTSIMKIDRPANWSNPPAIIDTDKPKRPLFERLPFFGGAVEGLSRRSFESRLSKLISSGLAHEQEGLPAGSEEYKRLKRMAEESVNSYCTRHQVDRYDLEAQIPAINKIRKLADPVRAELPVWLRPSTILGVVFLCTLVALVIGAEAGLVEATRANIVHYLVKH